LTQMSYKFLGTDSGYKDSKFVVVPVPYEATTSYGKGTKNGPAAILKASQQVEEFDEELGFETHLKSPVHTLKTTSVTSLGSRVTSLLSDKKIPVILGGEHSITPYVVKAAAKQYKHLCVLQFDAHADLRDRYRGKKNSHACVMRRILEICPAVQVGIRSISRDGFDFARKTGQLKRIHRAQKLELAEKVENQLFKHVYITIDVDVFDPSVMPSTGTPEPGGMYWYEVLDILKPICATKNVVGFDIMELSPRKGDIASDFAAAKLIYKIMGYLSAGK
jgi:agmatinase